MEKISWKSKLFFRLNNCSTYLTKHNSIWPKAVSMPLTIWNLFVHKSDNGRVTGLPLFTTRNANFATIFYTW